MCTGNAVQIIIRQPESKGKYACPRQGGGLQRGISAATMGTKGVDDVAQKALTARQKNKLKAQALAVIEALRQRYPDALCSLTWRKDYELLVSVRLSAQCTDAMVNVVTERLFAAYPTLESLAAADLAQLREMVRPCGFYKVKGKDIKDTCTLLLERHNGRVPDTMEELLQLPGVGRKSANLILGDVYGKPAVVTDTHCIRICNRLGLTDSAVPEKVEQRLWELLPPEESNNFCHRLVLFGREVCTARKPRCADCPLALVCPSCGGQDKTT